MPRKLQIVGKFPSGSGGDGLSAYEIAKKNGFEGTETEWLESLKGEPGDTGPQGPQGEQGDPGSGVYIGSEEPTDPNVTVWIDPEATAEEEENPAYIKVPDTAEVGQTIVVKAVDEVGKPTEWEAANFPSDEYINTLIDTKLGVIENGTY